MKSATFSRALKLAAMTLLLPCIAFAAPPRGGRDAEPTVIRAKPQLGAPVTPHSVNVDLRKLPKAKQWQPGMAIREAHRRIYYPLGTTLPHAPAGKRTAQDRLPELQKIWDESVPQRVRAKAAARGRANINNPNTGVSPGDPVVEVGANHVIYAVNSGGTGTYFNVYNKSGALVAGPTAFGSLAPSGNACTADRGDPLVHYDRQAGRWFMLTMDTAGFCTYVSKTSDPVTGGWWFYGYSTPTLPDYPHCGVWDNAYVCASNEGNAQVTLYAFDRANMLNGATARPAQRFLTVNKLPGYGFQILTPSTFYGTTAPPAGRKQLIARHRDDEAHDGASANGSQDFIELFELTLDWNTPANSVITALPRIAITEFNSWFRDYSTFATVPQPTSTTARLDPIREVLLNQLSYRNFNTHESLVGTLATNQDPARTGTNVDSGVRWFELRRVGSGNWTLHQEGTFSPGDSATHHLMGTAAMDKFGNIGMAYNVTKTSAPTKFATLGYTGRADSDPLGVMSLGENEVATGAAVESSGRWGDYYQTTVDPVDDCTFWFVGMYRPSGGWQTRIADFKFPACGGGTVTYTVSGSVTTSGGAGIGGVTVNSGSGSAVTSSTGAYTITGLADGSYTLTPSLSGFTFSPATRSVTVSGANVTGQNFTGTAVTYSVSGSVTTSGGAGISGVTVSTGSSSATTDSSGAYTITGLANGTYTLTPSLSGYTFSPANRSVTVSNASVTGQNFTGSTGGGGTQTYTNNTDYQIRDNRTVSSPITVSGRTGNGLSNTQVSVNIVHTYIQDLKVDLVAPDGTVYVLHNRTGGSADNIIRTYTVNLTSEPLNGTWNLRVNDNFNGDIGFINSWSVTF
jgi:Proprotein convertase P-domain/Carboxypeptidase regulatory-like domain